MTRIARDEKRARLTAEILADIFPMRAVARKQGFHLQLVPGDPQVVREELQL